MLVVVEVDEIEDVGISEIRRIVLHEIAELGSVMDSITVHGMGHHSKPARIEKSNFKFCNKHSDFRCRVTVGKNCNAQDGEKEKCTHQCDNPHNVKYIDE